MIFAPSKSRERAKIQIMGISKTSDHIKIKIEMSNPRQQHQASSTAPNQDFKDMDDLCTFKIKIESPNLNHWYNKDHWLYQNQNQDANSKSGTSSILQSSKWGLKGHGCSLQLQNQDKEPIFGLWVYQRQVTICKSESGCPTPVRNLQRPPKRQIRT